MYCFFLFLLLTSATFPAGQTNAGFGRMLDFCCEKFLVLNPSVASGKDNDCYNDRLNKSNSQPHRATIKQLYTQYSYFLKRYLGNQLSTRDKLDHHIFRYDLQQNLEGFNWPTHLTPIGQMSDFLVQFSQTGADAVPLQLVDAKLDAWINRPVAGGKKS